MPANDPLAALARPDPGWFVRPDGTDGSSGMHGVPHTLRVLVHAVELSRALDVAAWELESATLAALWHDIGRTDDGPDYYHGAKSAGKAIGLGLHVGVPPRVLAATLFAVTHHSGSEEHAERGILRLDDPEATLRIFRILKDADGLDRVRFDGLDPRYLRLGPSHARIGRAHDLLAAIPERRPRDASARAR